MKELFMTYGPIDFLVLEFKGNKFNGEIIPALQELVVNKVIRVIDLIIIQKDNEGHYFPLELQDIQAEGVRFFDPLQVEISGLIQLQDIELVGQELENNTTAALMMFENLWAIKFKQAVLDAEGKVIIQERIPHEVVEEALAIFAKAE
jgi:hypothetical protein